MEIEVSGQKVLIDDIDYQWLKINRASPFIDSKGYVNVSFRETKTILRLHFLILQPEKNSQVDHINGNKLDNRRLNLRYASNSQNQIAKPKCKKNATSQFKGVFYCKEKKSWLARCKTQFGYIHICNANTEYYAALMYNQFVYEWFGPRAYQNKWW